MTEAPRHKIRLEPQVVETDLLRFVISNEYVFFGISGSPVLDTDGPQENRRIVGGNKVGDDMTPLGNDEWSPSVRLLPCWVECEIRGGTEPDLRCKIELRNNVPRMVEFGWRASELQQEVRQKHLRAVPVDDLTQLIYGEWVIELHNVTRESVGRIVIPTAADLDHKRFLDGLLYDMRAGRRNVNAELLRQVADVYRANFDTAPAEAVARTFGVKPRMAHEYVRRARERGFLPPTTQGKKRI